MKKIAASIEQGFYAAIQWSLRHQARAVALIVLAVVIPIGTLNFLQYQSMVKYEQAGTQATQEQLKYLLGRLVLNSYTNLTSYSSDMVHAYDLKHEELFRQPRDQARPIINKLQAGADKLLKEKSAKEQETYRRNSFITIQGLDSTWNLSYPDSVKDARFKAAAVRAIRYFQPLSPMQQDVGYQYFYDKPTELLIFLHSISSEQIRYDSTAPPRPIEALMGISYSKENLKNDIRNNLTRRQQASRFTTSPLDETLSKANYYFQVKDEKGAIIFQDEGWKQHDEDRDYITADFVVTPEQRFLTGWQFSAMTRSALRQSTDRSLGQMFWASGVVTLLLCLLLVILFRAGLVAVKVSEMQADIVAGVSHDLKTPLAGIIASAQLIASGRASGQDETRQFSGYILTEARRLTGVVEKVLTLAKLESRQLLMQPSSIAVAELVEQAIACAQSAFPDAVILKGEVAQGQLCGDSSALTTVLVNLLDNAIRYSGDQHQPWVRVQAYWSGFGERRILHLMVEDRGVGIPSEEQPFIFQKFYRVRNGLVTDTEGTGLGLAIASQIVRAHRGYIHVKSEVGTGSTFTVRLPA